jgi:hypothetical protein
MAALALLLRLTPEQILGLAIGTNVQAYDADLSAIAGLSNTDGNFIVGNGSTWVAESGATARTSLGLTIGTDVQAYDADLTAIAGLANTDGNFIVGNGSTWVAESGSTARTSLGLGQLPHKRLAAYPLQVVRLLVHRLGCCGRRYGGF